MTTILENIKDKRYRKTEKKKKWYEIRKEEEEEEEKEEVNYLSEITIITSNSDKN